MNKAKLANRAIISYTLSVLAISLIWLYFSANAFNMRAANLALLSKLNANWVLDENYQINSINIDTMYA